MLALALLFSMAAVDAATDGPGRLDLAVDLRGQWSFESMTGCQEYMAITGTRHFAAGMTMCTIVPIRGMQQMIWQDCLEMTVSGGVDQSPLHHMILNDKYVTDDWTQAGQPAEWVSKIVPPTAQDVQAAGPVVVFHKQNASLARRYINSDGKMVMSWTASNNVSSAIFKIQFKKTRELPCRAYDPEECKERTYEDGEGSAGWTPACCLADYGAHKANPNELNCSFTPSSETSTSSASISSEPSEISIFSTSTSSVPSTDSAVSTTMLTVIVLLVLGTASTC